MKIIFIVTLLFFVVSHAQKLEYPYVQYENIAINEVMMFFSNEGTGSQHFIEAGWKVGGFYWPGGSNATKRVVYQDGLLWAGLINGKTVANGNYWWPGMQPGNIDHDGIPADPNHPDFKIWKVHNNWQQLPAGELKDRLEADWNNWPVHLGAPYLDRNANNTYEPEIDSPVVHGDELNWMVINDLDTAKTMNVFETLPIGIESQLSIYGYSNSALEDVVFKKYLLINKGNNLVEDMFLMYWSDPDLGAANDDFVGCDTTLDLWYCWNDKNFDEVYGEPAPALGYLLLQSPVVQTSFSDSAYFSGKWHYGYKELGMTAFVLGVNAAPRFDSISLDARGIEQMYSYMHGFDKLGNPIINPVTLRQTSFAVSGDPVPKTGWYEGEGWPGGPVSSNRYMFPSTGPFDFAPGDSQEVVYTIFMARGADHLDSITELKRKAAEVREFYFTGVLPSAIEGKPKNIVPLKFELAQNYPNPFNPTTTISYTLPAASKVKLTIFNMLGQQVQTLVNKQQPAGEQKVVFDAGDLASGVYYYRLVSDNSIQTKKMLLLR